MRPKPYNEYLCMVREMDTYAFELWADQFDDEKRSSLSGVEYRIAKEAWFAALKYIRPPDPVEATDPKK